MTGQALVEAHGGMKAACRIVAEIRDSSRMTEFSLCCTDTNVVFPAVVIRAGCLGPSTMDTGAESFFVGGWRVILCIVGRLAASLVSTHAMLVAYPPPSHDKQKLPDVP